MATGLALPLRVGPTGRTMTSTGDEQADKIIRLALADGDNDNAFQQDATLGLSHIFDVRNPGSRAKVTARLLRIFDNFERLKRFQLERNTIRWSRGGPGEQVLTFKYRNLESDEVIDFSRTFGGSSGGF